MAAKTYDAIVVGSGITGGWAAKELGEKGLETLVLEAGRPIDPDKDYAEHVPEWEVRYRGMSDRKRVQENQPVQETCGGMDEWNSKFFVNDKQNPYKTEPGKPFLWIRGRQVGGRSIIWGRQSYRWSDLDFEANQREGLGVDWPIRYKEIAPWYDYVEDFIGVSGLREGLPQLPDGHFLPGMELNCAEVVVKDAIAKYFPGERLMTIGRTAILTQPHKGRAPCHYCGPCARGCITRSYFSSLNSTLPAALTTGKVTVRPHSVVHSLMFDSKTRKITGVRVIDGQTRDTIEFRARIVFLCASALESARILLNSATPEFPNGLANSSGELGHNVMDHCMGGGATGRIPGNEDHVSLGNRPNGIYVPRFRNVKQKHPMFLRGYGFQGSASRPKWERGGDARLRSKFQADPEAPRTVDDVVLRIRRMSPKPRKFCRTRQDHGGRLGHSRAPDQLRLAGERARPAERHVDYLGGNAFCGRCEGHRTLHRGQRPRPHYSRNGYGAHGTRPENLGAQCAQPGARRQQSFCHRWRLHGVFFLRQPFSDLHGPHGSGL